MRNYKENDHHRETVLLFIPNYSNMSHKKVMEAGEENMHVNADIRRKSSESIFSFFFSELYIRLSIHLILNWCSIGAKLSLSPSTANFDAE